MISYRKKILISDFLLFLLFLVFLFPFVGRTIGNIIHNSLEERTNELIQEVGKADTIEGLIQELESKRLIIFYRFSLIDSSGKVLYETHFPPQSSPRDKMTLHPEVRKALKEGTGYSEGFSTAFNERFAYLAKSFTFQGNEYVIRTAFPLKEVRELTNSFEFGFLTMGTLILLLYSLMTWAIIHRLSKPIQKIIDAIKPFQEGKEEFLPQIELEGSIDPQDDFGKLANTMNALSSKIQTQIETLTQERNEKESILESLEEGVIAVNAQAEITFINNMACKQLQFSKKQLQFQRLNTLPYDHDLLNLCREMVIACQEKEQLCTESLVMEGAQRQFIDLLAIPKPYQTGAVVVVQDKTSDYKVVQMGKDFVANASHELKTPITIIRGFAETLHDNEQLSQDMQKEIMHKIVNTCIRLDNIVQNLLALADLDNRTESSFTPCSVHALLEQCKQQTLALHPEVQFMLEVEREDLEVAGHTGLLEQAFTNLLENAVKYSTSPAQISVEAKQKKQQVVIKIEDEGIGIPEVDQEHIFERFYRVDKARSRKAGGTGLGLSIVKKIIEKHEGSIRVTSNLGKGTCFTLVLPTYEAYVKKIASQG